MLRCMTDVFGISTLPMSLLLIRPTCTADHCLHQSICSHALYHQVTTLLLDKMRRIKNRMVRLKTRVETIRELLEKFLEDEGDMKNMNLTARWVLLSILGSSHMYVGLHGTHVSSVQPSDAISRTLQSAPALNNSQLAICAIKACRVYA